MLTNRSTFFAMNAISIFQLCLFQLVSSFCPFAVVSMSWQLWLYVTPRELNF